MIRNTRRIILLTSLVAVLLLLTLIYEDTITLKRARTIRIQNIDFKSRAQGAEPAPARELHQGEDNYRFKAIDIHIRMKVYSITEHNNVFQTAPANQGIRLELAKPSTLALVVGSSGPEGLKGFILTRSLQLDRWYSVDITITRDKRLKVSLDNRTVVDSPERNIDFIVSDVAVGTGFSKTRPFDGVIEGFSITCRFFEKRYGVERLLLMFKMILISGLVCLILFLLAAPQASLKPWLSVELPSVIILIGFTCAVFYYYNQGAYVGWRYPFDTFLSNPGSTFTFFSGPLFPSAISIIVFALLPAIGFIAYTYRNVSASASGEVGKAALYTHVLIFSFLTYPFFLAFDRKSPELILFLLVALFAHSFSQKKFGASGCFLALAAGFKMYPLAFLALFVVHKKYKEALLCSLLAAAITGAAFLFAGQTFDRWTDILFPIGPQAWTYVSPKAAMHFNSSLFGALHFSTVSLFGLWSGSHLLRIYVGVAPILFLLLIYWLVKPETDMWKQFLFLFITTLILMPVSPEDRLLLLFIPFWLLAQRQGARESDLFYAVSIAALLIPSHYLFAYEGAEQAGRSFASISLVLNPVIMVAILSKGVRDALKTKTTPGMAF